MADLKYYNEPSTVKTDYNAFYVIGGDTLFRYGFTTFITASAYEGPPDIAIDDPEKSLVVDYTISQNGLEPERHTKTVAIFGGSVCCEGFTGTTTIEDGTTITAIGPGATTKETWVTILGAGDNPDFGATGAYISQSVSTRQQYQTIYDNAGGAHAICQGKQTSIRQTTLDC